MAIFAYVGPKGSGKTHFITANQHGDGNVTACGKLLVYPIRGTGWSVRDVICADCDRAICGMFTAKDD